MRRYAYALAAAILLSTTVPVMAEETGTEVDWRCRGNRSSIRNPESDQPVRASDRRIKSGTAGVAWRKHC